MAPQVQSVEGESIRWAAVLAPLPAWQLIVRDPFANTALEGGGDWVQQQLPIAQAGSLEPGQNRPRISGETQISPEDSWTEQDLYNVM